MFSFFFCRQKQRIIKEIHKLWNGSKNLIEKINDKPGENEKDFMKIEFNSEDNLPLNKILKLHNLTIVARSVFQDDNKYYQQFFLDECLYEFKKAKM